MGESDRAQLDRGVDVAEAEDVADVRAPEARVGAPAGEFPQKPPGPGVSPVLRRERRERHALRRRRFRLAGCDRCFRGTQRRGVRLGGCEEDDEPAHRRVGTRRDVVKHRRRVQPRAHQHERGPSSGASPRVAVVVGPDGRAGAGWRGCDDGVTPDR